MLRICRAEDGEFFQVNGTIWDIERSGSLEGYLHEVTGVAPEDAIAYLSNGVRLTNENLRELAGSNDNKIFVFDKYYLDYDLEHILQKLRFHPSLQPHIEDPMSSTPPFRPSQVAAAFLRAAHAHREVIAQVVSSITLQHEALQIASHTLDLNVLSLEDTYETFAVGGRRELENQAVLLSSLDLDLDMISRVAIHLDFISENMRKAIEAGDKARTLGDYVSKDKMRQVAATCTKLHAELLKRFDETSERMDRLKQGSDAVRETLSTSRFIEQAEASQRRVQDAVDMLSDISANPNPSNVESVLQELRQADLNIRHEVEVVGALKNSTTELCLRSLRQISFLNDDLVELPAIMSQFQAEIRTKNSFPHIQRLHSLLYAYGATLVEIVRRKEFSRFFYQRAQTILEVMAKLSSTERKRRQIYRSEVLEQVPFALRKMDEAVPTIDFTPTGGGGAEYTIERPDVDSYMETLDSLQIAFAQDPRIDTSALMDIREALMKLIARMDGLEGSFERTVERSILSGSRLSSSRRRLTEADEAAFHELSEQLLKAQQEKEDQQRAFLAEKESMKAEIARLQSSLENSRQTTEREQDRSDALSRDVHVLRAQNESDAQARRVLEQRHIELLADVERLRSAQVDNLSSATEQAKEAETLRQELAQTKAEFEDVKNLEAGHSQKIKQLLDDQTLTLLRLEEARQRGEDLEAQIHAARQENDDVGRALKEAGEQKDKLLRAQALEHDRIMRDHIAEADGDRAVLERQFFEAKAALDDSDRQLKEALSKIEVLNADATGLREELQHTEHALREARHVERVLRGDLSAGRASQSDYEKKITDRDRLVAEILDVAISFRDSHVKAFSQLHQMSIHPSSGSKGSANLADSILSPTTLPPRMTLLSPLHEEAPPIDPTDPAAALETLRSYDLDAFSETVTKVGSVMRKLLKQCKDYRERAKGKISFRNFAKGDLALFLPTRNSQSKPWAAFNVSFPHYFLNATGRLAEQLKTREWIVARITSLTERIVDSNDPSTNPYGLGDGTKYYLLEVEDWTQPGSAAAKRRKASVKPSSPDSASSPPRERPISPPPADPIQPGVSAAESLGATRSPTSHLFPVRTRSNSASAGPSSLSRLLAQANQADSQLETIPSTPPYDNKTPSPLMQQTPPSPTRQIANTHSPIVHSPLRPASRASSSSRLSFSGGRIPPFPTSSSSGSASLSKAVATTALSGEGHITSPPTPSSVSSSTNRAKERLRDKRSSSPLGESLTPSPTHSASEGLANILPSRRRTTSEHVPPIGPNRNLTAGPSVGASASNALASIASWSVSIGRRKRASMTQSNVGTSNDIGRSSSTRPSTPASELLKRF